MRRRFLTAIGLAGIAAWGAIAFGQSGEIRAPRPPQGYLAPNALDEKSFLPPPPDVRSAAGKADLAIFRATRSFRDTQRWKMAAQDNAADQASLLGDFSCALGTKLKPADAPALSRLLQRSTADAGPLIGPPKDRYARSRPFLKAKGPVCISLSPEFSRSGGYPSGHSTVGWLYALVLAEVSPDRASTLLARGRAFGESRVVCGVHYASDVEAGYLVAASLTAVLNSSPAFRDDLATAKIELAQIRQRATAPDAAQCASEQMILFRRPW